MLELIKIDPGSCQHCSLHKLHDVLNGYVFVADKFPIETAKLGCSLFDCISFPLSFSSLYQDAFLAHTGKVHFVEEDLPVLSGHDNFGRRVIFEAIVKFAIKLGDDNFLIFDAVFELFFPFEIILGGLLPDHFFSDVS